MIFKKLIDAINRNTDEIRSHMHAIRVNTRAVNARSRVMSYTIAPRMVHDSFATYLSSAGDDLDARVKVVRRIASEMGVAEISELTHDQFYEALEKLNVAKAS